MSSVRGGGRGSKTAPGFPPPWCVCPVEWEEPVQMLECFSHGEVQCSPGKGGGNFPMWLISCPLANQEGNHPV